MKKNKLLTSLFLLCILFVSFMPIQSAAAAKTGEKNLYYILTPYSGLGAASIALGKPSKDVNDAFIYDDSRFTKECINKFKSIFDNVYILGRDNETVGRKKYDNCYSANTYFSPGQKYFHFEDGSAEYLSTLSEGYFCDVNLVKKVFLTFPQYRCQDLKKVPAAKLNQKNFKKAIKTLYGENSVKQEIIYCLEYPTDLNIKKTNSVINLLKKYSNDVLIKNHPRDTKQYFFPKGFTTVDRHVAFESLCYNFEGIVISNSSSVLHTAKFISPNITVICTKFIDTPFNLDSSDFNYISMLKNLGVLFPKSLDELKNLIAEHY